jgi:hypothetical protein
MKALNVNRGRVLAGYLKVVDDEERLRREAIAAWELAEAKRARRRRIVVSVLVALAALVV